MQVIHLIASEMQVPTYFPELTYHAGQVVNDFN